MRKRILRGILFAVLLVGVLPLDAGERDFKLGLEVFLRGYTYLVRGRRVGLLTNQSGIDRRGQSSIDLLNAHPDVDLVKLFSPEHGIRGDVGAGEKIDDTVDSRTGLPIISLYGKHGYRPKAQHLSDVDVLIYDIQDVGSRAYTYIWSLGEAMTACAQNGVRVVVLDRPCVFGATTIDGPICDPKYNSLLTRFPIPRVYGMTCGEIARYFNSIHQINCHLTVIPMAGYRRGMPFEDTGARWVPPSPNIPDLNAARCFPATGTLGELSKVHIGIGTNLPFQMIGAPWLDNQAMAQELNSYQMEGVEFDTVDFIAPERGFFAGQRVRAITIQVTEPAKFDPASAELIFFFYLAANYPREFSWSAKRSRRFDRAMGTATVRTLVMGGASYKEILQYWARQQAMFKKYRRRVLIYE